MATYTGGATYGRATAGRGGWSIAEGVLLIIVGLIAIGAPFITTAIAGIILPIVLLIKGIALIISSARDRTFGGIVLGVLLGLAAIAAAVWLFFQPAIGILAVPYILATYFLIAGILQIIAAFAYRGRGWGWVLFSGLVNLVLAGLIFFGPFGRSLLIAGIYLGVSVLFTGIALLVQGWGHTRYEDTGYYGATP